MQGLKVKQCKIKMHKYLSTWNSCSFTDITKKRCDHFTLKPSLGGEYGGTWRYLTWFFAGTLDKRYGCMVSLFLSVVHSLPRPKINYGGCCLLRGPQASEDTSTRWASLLPTRGGPISASPALSAARPSASTPLAGSRVCSSPLNEALCCWLDYCLLPLELHFFLFFQTTISHSSGWLAGCSPGQIPRHELMHFFSPNRKWKKRVSRAPEAGGACACEWIFIFFVFIVGAQQGSAWWIFLRSETKHSSW